MKKIEKLPRVGEPIKHQRGDPEGVIGGYTWQIVGDKINEIIEAVNKLTKEEKQSKKSIDFNIC